jgi:hypothetical protein
MSRLEVSRSTAGFLSGRQAAGCLDDPVEWHGEEKQGEIGE